jgi:hypothetical protein
MNAITHPCSLTPSCAGLLSLVVLAYSPLAGSTGAATYDFETLPLNRTLNGNDGWLSEPSIGELITRQDESPENGSQVAQPYAGLASGWYAMLTRVNDENFGFAPFWSTEPTIVTQVDVTGMAAAGAALGKDLDGDGLLMLADGERGPVFGTYREAQQGVPNFFIQSVSGAAYAVPLTGGDRCCNLDSDWYRLQLRVDLAGYNGSGSGSLYYRNLTAGDTAFTPVVGLQEMRLELEQMAPGAEPDQWNAMFLTMRFDGSRHMPSLDNLVPHVPSVLSDDLTLTLNGVEAGTDGLRYDLVLAPDIVAADPGGVYWRLASVRQSGPDEPGAARLTPDWDLEIDRIDTVEVLDGIDAVTDVVLLFDTWDGADPKTMRWVLDSYAVD